MAGFTLIELLIVITMLGTLLAMAVPQLKNFRRAQTIRSSATGVSMALNVARSRAASLNRIVRVTFAPGSLTPAAGFYAVYADSNKNFALDSGEVALAGVAAGAARAGVRGFGIETTLRFGKPDGIGLGPLGVGIPADGVSFTTDQIGFMPDGTATEVGDAILLDPDGRVYAISVSAGGSTRVYHLVAGNWK